MLKGYGTTAGSKSGGQRKACTKQPRKTRNPWQKRYCLNASLDGEYTRLPPVPRMSRMPRHDGIQVFDTVTSGLWTSTQCG